jgi:hypothetical protein
MGSVRDLYTTGDNDPEIEARQYYRHYLYCDACGSFDLTPWTSGNLEKIERTRHRLAMGALIASPLVIVALWSLLGFVLSPVVLVALAAATVIVPVLRGWVTQESAATRWRFVRRALLAMAMLLLAEGLVNDVVSPGQMLSVGVLLIVGLLVARALVDSNNEYLGLRCRQCDATYAHGTPFFTDLEANPRHLTVADVPRPKGSSPFERGASVEGS